MKICIVGLGYVGLPLACLLSEYFEVIGFDVSVDRIKELSKGKDKTGEVENINQCKIHYTNNEEDISKTDFVIVAVPTPIDENFQPDLSLIKSASEIVGRNMQSGTVVVFESRFKIGQ